MATFTHLVQVFALHTLPRPRVHLPGEVNMMSSPTPGKKTGFLNKKVSVVTSSWKHDTVVCWVFVFHFRLILWWLCRGLNLRRWISAVFTTFWRNGVAQKASVAEVYSTKQVCRGLSVPTVHQCGVSVTALVTPNVLGLFGFPHVWGIPLF